MDIIVHDPGRYHVSLDAVWEFEEAVNLDPQARLVSSRESLLAHVPNLAWRALFRALNGRAKKISRPLYTTSTLPDVFAILMGPNFRKTMPRFLAAGTKGIYLFDAWVPQHAKISHFANACQIDHLFVSSSQAATALSLLVKSTQCHWVPEGITPGDYFLAFKPERDIDVLQLGRRFDKYHRLIAPELQRRGKKYLCEQIPGKVIFPTRLDYVEGLARTKISICAPLSVTHPERAGGIETMTARYLQSMLSKCLVVGHAPAEMIQHFGYNPLIEIDYRDASGQLLGLLDRFEEYQPLIEENYRMVREHHTWESRWQQIKRIFRGETAAAPPVPAAPTGSR
jgi:hypothetical protein